MFPVWGGGGQEQDSDTEWYRQEVGDEPDELFKKNVKSRKNAMKV
jgi:hypothetical protein